MDINITKFCPVHEAYQFSSPLVTTDQFKGQCAAVIDYDNNFLNYWKKEKEAESSDTNRNEELAEHLQTDTRTVEELHEVCDVTKLQCDFEDKYDYNRLRIFEEFPSNVSLQTLRMVKQGKTKMEEIHFVPSFNETVREVVGRNDKIVPFGGIILDVSVFHAEKRRVQQEFYVLPNQKLTDLRDCINCQSDCLILGEFSNNPDVSLAKTAKDICNSSFFFIEHCFYNDTRNAMNRDYSKVIIDWAKSSDRYTVSRSWII